jgi:hypothetical protein
MKLRYSIVLLFLVCSSVSYAQPRWSPEIRSQREMEWMKDNLHLTETQLEKIKGISLDYQRNMDKAANSEDKNTGKKIQHQLIRLKDSDLKAILNKKQYDKYYDRELIIRQRENEHLYEGNRQTY